MDVAPDTPFQLRFRRLQSLRRRPRRSADCGGAIETRLVTPAPAVAEDLPADYVDHVQAELECESCATTTRCPVSLTLLAHPAVVSLYHEHDRAVDERPIWNVGSEWAEAVLSDDPLAVRVVVELNGDTLALYVDESLEVVDVQRASADHSRTDATAGSTESPASSHT